MSFSSETKNELARMVAERKCCMIAEIAGFIRFAGSVRLKGSGKLEIVMVTASPAIARHYKTLIKNYFSVETSLGIGQSEGVRKRKEYFLSIGPENLSEQILRETGILMVKEGRNVISDGIYEGLIKTKCCRRSYLRGAFLAAGTISNPEKGYHFEVTAGSELLAKDLRRLLNGFVDISSKIVKRKNNFGVYLKRGEQVRDSLGIMGASGQFLKFDNIMMVKEIRAETNRGSNMINANINKTIGASEKQIADIKKIEKIRGLDHLPERLKYTAEMRMRYPEISMEELGRIMDPPISKSGISSRLKRIKKIADEIK